MSREVRVDVTILSSGICLRPYRERCTVACTQVELNKAEQLLHIDSLLESAIQKCCGDVHVEYFAPEITNIGCDNAD